MKTIHEIIQIVKNSEEFLNRIYQVELLLKYFYNEDDIKIFSEEISKYTIKQIV